MNSRILWIDALKGVGILLVMINHSCNLTGNWHFLFNGFMPLFFVASGYTSSVNLSFEKWMTKKAKSLLFPYLFYAGLSILEYLYISVDGPISYRLWGVAYSRYYYLSGAFDFRPILMDLNSPMWFLPALFVSSIWFYFYTTLRTSGWRWGYILLLLLFSYAFLHFKYLLPWSVDTSFMGALFIIWGYEIKPVFFSKKLALVFLLFLSMALFFVGSSFLKGVNMSIRDYGGEDLLHMMLFFLVGISETTMLSCLLYLIEKTYFCNALAFVGRLSLRIMCIHLFVFLIVFSIFPGKTVSHSLCAIFASVLMSYLLGIMYHRISRYYPFFSFL